MRLKIWLPKERLIGAPAIFSMEARIFNILALFIIVILCFNAVENYIFGLRWLGLLMLFAAVLLAGMFYISRVQKKLWLAVLLFGFLGNALLAVNYFYNSGFNGPGLYILLLQLFLITAIAPKKQYLFWLIVNPLAVCILLYLNYTYPDLIVNSYVNRLDNYADIGYSYVIIAAVISMVTIFLKNTYYKQKNELEHQAVELKNSNQTKEKLLSIIAHDLRSPLASIQNYLEILNEYDFSAEEKKKMEQELLNKTKNTEQMVSNLLYWSMNQMNGVIPKPVALDVKATAASVLQIIQLTASDKGIDIDDLLPAGLSVLADQDMLQLMIRNIVSNAVKFTHPGGKVSIRAKAEDSWCKISISDNGLGIPLDMQQSVFSLKTNSTYGTGNEKGTGLGLVLCKEFAELQNGSISFTSKHKEGTTFTIKLPCVGVKKNLKNQHSLADLPAKQSSSTINHN